MYSKRVAARVDSTQNDVVVELRKLPGVTVSLGHDDFIVGYKGKNSWIEWKSGNPYKKNGEFKKGYVKKSQKKLHENWRGQYDICWKLNQVLNIIGYDKAILI